MMARPAYYNEIEPYAAAWLRNLIAAGHIAPGEVDERSIEDVAPDDLAGFGQCHFFAGIGVWSHALRRAGWEDDRPVWTGSCPCQPFSSAGKGAGFADERHLWPAFFHLIGERRPRVVMGEQVASKDGLAWLDLVSADMEGAAYAFGAADLCAAGVGAPHIRQRLWWVAERADGVAQGDAVGKGLEGHARHGDDRDEPGRVGAHAAGSASPAGGDGGLALACEGERGRLADACARNQPHGPEAGRVEGDGGAAGGERAGWLADAGGRGLRDSGRGAASGAACSSAGAAREQRLRPDGASGGHAASGGASEPGPTNGLWRDADWLFCRDGKWRPVEPGTFPLADGAPARVGRLRAYGNAIVAPAAEAVIRAFMEARP